ncbi:MAG TPA: glutamate 5-kinase [Dehalococcoidia bacterium]|nr:glutamate 5-kinase [Dehalococcoidia bacterium]
MSKRRFVVKLGTSLLTSATDHLDLAVMADLVEQAAQLHRRDREIIIVSSGAVAAGRERMRGKRLLDVDGIPLKQVLASIGQSHLMSTYEMLFSQHDIIIAQALLTRDCLVNRAGYLNARNTLMALCDMGVVCIVNENDVVAVEELEDRQFGDNDNLSAMVANLVDADLLIILTDIAGLFTADPRHNRDAQLIRVVERIDENIEALAGGTSGAQGIGGMATKVQAARIATTSGIEVVVAAGREKDVHPRIDRGEEIDTRSVTHMSRLESRKRWLLSGLNVAGELIIDEGAVRALKRGAGSLLPAGVKDVHGSFVRGDTVEIRSEGGRRVASGIVNYDADDVRTVMGHRSHEMAELLPHVYGDEIVHRNNMVVF